MRLNQTKPKALWKAYSENARNSRTILQSLATMCGRQSNDRQQCDALTVNSRREATRAEEVGAWTCHPVNYWSAATRRLRRPAASWLPAWSNANNDDRPRRRTHTGS